ncbi:hypothetical protein VNO77_34406 [Canavalia gladiata]|uniref:Uncharacterized protein n=1 Tax=Canavalia gladiata TaxID=3824 RepID=A0AAN9Q1S0_CANGL
MGNNLKSSAWGSKAGPGACRYSPTRLHGALEEYLIPRGGRHSSLPAYASETSTRNQPLGQLGYIHLGGDQCWEEPRERAKIGYSHPSSCENLSSWQCSRPFVV